MKARYYFILAVVAVALSGWLVSAHQRKANDMVAAILAKDATVTTTESDQVALRTYVERHMGVSAKVYLNSSYDRAIAAASATASPVAGSQVYAQAQAACASRADSIRQASCVTNYVNSHAQSSTNPQTPPAVPDKSQFTKSYTAPGWTPDSAGLVLLVAMVAAAAGLYRALMRR